MITTGCYKNWEKVATKKQIEIRDYIEKEAKLDNEPPSIMEFMLIKKGKVNKDWNK